MTWQTVRDTVRQTATEFSRRHGRRRTGRNRGAGDLTGGQGSRLPTGRWRIGTPVALFYKNGYCNQFTKYPVRTDPLQPTG
jgi:hypothetical protein